MSDEEIQIDRAALVEAFVAESREILESMEQLLLALEANPEDDESLHALFRAAHTIKGSSSLVAFDDVRDLAHAAEGLLDRLRAKVLRATDVLVSLLLQTVDVLRDAIAAAAAEREAPSAVRTMREQLARAAAGDAVEGGSVALSAAQAQVAARAARSDGRTLRVDVARLDRMLDLAGEIGISRGRLTTLLERGLAGREALLEAHREADRLYLDLQDLVMQARMVPLGPAFRPHLRTVRDLAAAQRKQVYLHLEGEDVEVDTAVVELIRDPLTHMVRNAVDHGCESPEQRRALGKPPCAQLTLRAYHEGGLVVIQLEDDGKGLDRERILRRAIASGIVPEGAALGDAEIDQLVFQPGFSTAEQVTDVSGRGVGMDVVLRNVHALRGTVAIDTAPGRGTTFALRIPLTLAIIQGFRVGVGEEVYVLPLEAVAECLQLPAGAPPGETGVFAVRGAPLPFVRLRDHFGVPGDRPARESVVVVQHGGARVGLAVDALLGDSQTVIKPLGRMFHGLRNVAGSSILGDGRVALILDVAGLLREVGRRPPLH